MRIECEIEVSSDVEHLRQIYTGYSILARQGFLKLRQTIPNEALRDKNNPNRWTDYKFFNLRVTLNGNISIIYDVHDWNRIDEEILAGADFYFKRSFDPEYVSGLAEPNKVFPLGLNYPVSIAHVDIFKLQRSRLYSGTAKLKAVAKALRLDRFGIGRGEVERIDILESEPDIRAEPKILFMTRLWNPETVEDKRQKNAIEAINEMRAECVRALRAEFRDRFFGGLARDEYSIKYFADCLLPDTGLSDKRVFLEILRKHPVCVATTGLNGSNGWKLGEYVAFSKAIISEPLKYTVPGNFAKNSNYLEFSSPEDLVGAAASLFENRELRGEMMTNNRRYYQKYVRPDAMILNSLNTVFHDGQNPLRKRGGRVIG